MHSEELRSKLIAAAKTIPADERVPLAFEQRVMAHLRAAREIPDAVALWSRALWKAAAPCGFVAALLLGWVLLDYDPASAPPPHDLAVDLEGAILAEIEAESVDASDAL